MSRDWSFLDALKAETDESLDRDPGRWSWGRPSKEVLGERWPEWSSNHPEQRPARGQYRRTYDRAREDYERQTEYARRDAERQEREDARSLRDLARERQQARDIFDRDERDEDPGEGRGLFW